MLTVDKLSFSYGAVQALHEISLKAEPGKITCVMGRNGVGKTTLLRNIMGTLMPSKGSVKLGGKELATTPANARAKAGVALVPQGRQIFPRLTVRENIEVGLQARTDKLRKVPEAIFELFPVLYTMANRMGGDLSGGQQQQLAIARAMVGEPKVLLLDEPTEGIQPNVIQHIGVVLQKLARDRNVAVVLVEQYLDFVKEIGHDYYIVNRGRIACSGVTAELSEELIHKHLSV